MPNVIRGLSPYVQTGNPDTVNIALTSLTGGGPVPGSFQPYAAGDLGVTWEYQDKAYTMVVVDSGCTAATPTGLVLANQLLYWKDKANRIVTNDSRFCLNGAASAGFENFVAGVARIAVGVPGTGGNLIFMLIRGINIPVISSAPGTVGGVVASDTSTTVPRVAPQTVGTMPSYLPLGAIHSLNTATLVNCDLDIPMLP